MDLTKEILVSKAKELMEEQEGDFEFLGTDETSIFVFDGDKESEIRFPELLKKKELLTDIIEILPRDIDRDKVIHLLCLLDDELFLSVKKILFFETEEQYLGIMEQHFENADRIDFHAEVGKYLYYEDWILINMNTIKETAKEMTSSEKEFREEVSIGVLTTLIHELRHSYQQLFFADIPEEEDEEDDAEFYCRDVFEKRLIQEDYILIR